MGSTRKITPEYLRSKCLTGEKGCLEWQAAKDSRGYGRIWHNGNAYPAHRLMYELCVRKPEKKEHVDHLCRNVGCINPEHLEAVSHAENMRRGSNAKLDHNQVTAVKILAKANFPKWMIAEWFGVTRANISLIITDVGWKGVGDNHPMLRK